MKYISTTKTKKKVSLQAAIRSSLPQIDGLWVPEKIEPLPRVFFENYHKFTFQEICFQVAQVLFPEIDRKVLNSIITEAYTFEPKLKSFSDLFFLELFHGPTLTFKDYGAQFLSGLYEYLFQNENFIILAATSGDTGSAVAHAFYKKVNCKVVILYPKGRLSEMQLDQIVTLGHNVYPIEVDGSFDDCQKLVKQAFMNSDVNSFVFSANSINIGRLLPQVFYYIYLTSRLRKKKVILSIPSGNLGNLTGALVAKALGAPIERIVVATNQNNTFSRYVETGEYVAKEASHSYSSAMDVGNPSNFQRVIHFYPGLVELREVISAVTISEEKTVAGIREVYDKYGYMIDPHTAVGYQGLKQVRGSDSSYYKVVISTAHPVKFKELVESTLGEPVPFEKQIKGLQRKSIQMQANYSQLKLDLIWNVWMPKTLIFIGMPSAGKTTIGKRIADLTGRRWEDTDCLLEEKYSMDVSQQVKQFGNAKFLALEKELLLGLDMNGLILSTGGCAIYHQEFFEENHEKVVIYLYLPYKTVERRLGDLKERGVVMEPEMSLKNLYDERTVYYERYHDIKLNTDIYDEATTISQLIFAIKSLDSKKFQQ